VVRERAFADHHPYSQGEIEALIAEARRDGLILVTTEKDLARLRTAAGIPSWANDIVPFAVTLEFDDAAALRKFVSDRLFKAREKSIAPFVGGKRACNRCGTFVCRTAGTARSAPCPFTNLNPSRAGKCRCSTAFGIA
jgi:hypothetical protein